MTASGYRVLVWFTGRETVVEPGRDPFTRLVRFNIHPENRGPTSESLSIGERSVPLALVPNRRARRYVLRLRPDGSLRVTIPRGGSAAEARRFAGRNVAWIEKALTRLSKRPEIPKEWSVGTPIRFRGEQVTLEPGEGGASVGFRLGDEQVEVACSAPDLRPTIERHLRRMAARELPLRVRHYAALHELAVNRVTVRNQRSRWGSCSRRRTISLNWRLIQVPAFVRDYIILHELMHLREMNHSARFWAAVEKVCPDYPVAERWLKQHSTLLRS